MARCKIQYIGNDMGFGVPLLIALGLIFTIWSATFFVIALNTSRVFYWYLDGAVYIPIVLTLLIILACTALALFYGVKQNNPNLVRSWYIVKIIECILVVLGVAVNIPNMFRWYSEYGIFGGLLLLPFGIYLIACVKKIYKNMTSPSSIYQEVIIEPPVVPKC